MFLIRISLGIKNACFVSILKHMIKAYLNSEIGIKIYALLIIQTNEMRTVRKSSDLFSESITG
jgi:hypothetical protein